jgi:hypothetical protein
VISAISAAEAGRIRDAARVVRAAGVIAVISFVVWLFWDPAYIGVAAWPLGLFVLALACFPLLRPIGLTVAMLLTLLAVGGLVAAVVGILVPPPDRSFGLGNVYGAGFIAYGAWFVGAGAVIRELRTLDPKVATQMTRGGIGLAVLGASWFIDDVGIGLAMLLVGIVFIGGIDRFIREIRTFGLAPEQATPAAVPVEPSEWISPDAPPAPR